MGDWLEESGRVVALETDAVWIETDKSAACDSCSARSGCGHGSLASLLSSEKGLIRAGSSKKLTASECSLGDEVVIEIRGSTVLGGALLIYGGPLLLASLSTVLLAPWGDIASIFAFAVSLLVSFVFLQRLGRSKMPNILGLSEPTLAAKSTQGIPRSNPGS